MRRHRLTPAGVGVGRLDPGDIGATFLGGSGWGGWEGGLIVSTLKEEDLRRFTLGGGGDDVEKTLLDGRFGRLRAATIGPDGALYVSTANGTDDRILRVTR